METRKGRGGDSETVAGILGRDLWPLSTARFSISCLFLWGLTVGSRGEA